MAKTDTYAPKPHACVAFGAGFSSDFMLGKHATWDSQDSSSIELQRVHSTPYCREARVIAIGLCDCNNATTALRAVLRTRVSCLPRVIRKPTTLRGVERKLVVPHVVNGLDDVNLAIVGPVDTLKSKSWETSRS